MQYDCKPGHGATVKPAAQQAAERLETWKKRWAVKWPGHARHVGWLKEQLESVDRWVSCRPAHGALDPGLLRHPAREKNAADLEVFLYGQLVSFVEVTGSDWAECPPDDYWVDVMKVEKAREKAQQGVPYFFALFYPNATHLLTLQDIDPYRDNIVERNGLTLVAVPPGEGTSLRRLFQWLRDLVSGGIVDA